MRITLLDTLAPDPNAPTVHDVIAELGDVTTHPLGAERFGPCEGCFECWVAHPGTCKAKDDANRIMRDWASADEVVWRVTPFLGGWSSAAKRALDKCIGLILPFFTTVDGETHHKARYARLPRLGVVAEVDAEVPDVERARFAHLVGRNALNLGAPHPWVAWVRRGAPVAEVRAAVAAARAAPDPGFPAQPPFVEPASRGVPAGPTPRRVLLVVGSAKTGEQSTSSALGHAVLARLRARGWATAELDLPRVVKLGRPDVSELQEAVANADLVVLAFPVYFDSLPALVTAAFERLRPRFGGPALLPVVQCGFPELAHTGVALELCAAAAARLGFAWAGHLALGGAGPLRDAPLHEARGVAWRQVQALDRAAAELDAGGPVTGATGDLFSTPMMPAGFYRLAGDLGWLAGAFQHGALTALLARPFEPGTESPPG